MPEARLLTILNPAGGKGQARSALAVLSAALQPHGFHLEVRETTRPGDASRHAAGAVNGAPVCVIGGDGTLHEVVNGLMLRATPPPPLLLIPCGTGNVVAQELGLPDGKAAIAALLANSTRAFDLLRLESAGIVRYAVSIAGWGGTAEINATAERLRFAGTARYSLAALLHLLIHRSYAMELTLDGERLEAHAHLAIACNTRRTGTDMLIAPQGRPDDGRMDVVIAHRTSRRCLLRLFQAVRSGRHVDLPFVTCRPVRSLEVRIAGSTTVNLDGERIEAAPLSSVRVMPAALHFFAPQQQARAASRPESPP